MANSFDGGDWMTTSVVNGVFVDWLFPSIVLRLSTVGNLGKELLRLV